jgi:hypothetical protein
LVEPQNQCGGGFPSLGLKTSSYGLVTSASKSPLWFLDLGLKTKQALVCRLCHQNLRGDATVWDERRDLAACFAWKEVGIRFPSLPSKLVEARRRVVNLAPSRRLYRGQVEDEWVDATGCIGSCHPCFAIFLVIGPRGIVVFLVSCLGV